jgi:quercetin dioxygenase-like cupin family protein
VQCWDLLALDAEGGTRTPVVLHSDESARAVLIAIRPGQSLGEHQVKETEWLVVLDGEAELGAMGAATQVRRGTLVRFDPDERRTVASDRGARILLLFAPWPGEGHYRGG